MHNAEYAVSDQVLAQDIYLCIDCGNENGRTPIDTDETELDAECQFCDNNSMLKFVRTEIN